MSADAILSALVEPAGADTGDTSTVLLDTEIARRCQALSTREAGGLYARWRTHPAARQGWSEPAWGTPDDERLLAELRAIEFWALDACAARLAALVEAADALRDAVDAVGGGLHDAWADAVATAAAGRFGRYAAGVRGWQDGLTQLAVGIDGGRDVVSGVLRGWADDARDLDIRVDDPALRQAQIDRVDDALGRGALWGRTFRPDELRAEGACDLNLRGVPAWPSHDVLAWLDEFCGRYDAVVGRFRAGLRAVHDAVGQTWQAVAELAKAVDPDPFAAALAGAAPADPVTGGDRVVIRDGGRAMTLVGPDERGRYGLTVDGRAHVLELAGGSAVVQDGSTTITAEQIGPGRVRLTVDDGSGPPQQYTIESSDAPQAKPAEAADGGQSGASATGGGPGSGGGPGGGGPAGGDPGGASGSGGSSGAGAGTGATAPGEGAMSGAQELEGERKPAPAAAAAGGGAAAGGAAGGGGMPMGGGGMGAGAGAGGQGGDNERKSSQWRVQGSLFDETDPAVNFDGVIGAVAPKG
ncbi:hypothetical protein [Actinokineospora sp. NPDC004072]